MLTLEDLTTFRAAWQQDARNASVVATLVDCREVTSWNLSSSNLRHFADTRRDSPHLLRSDSRLAIVATTDVGFGLARLYAMSGRTYGQIEVFRTLEEAEAWLSDTTL